VHRNQVAKIQLGEQANAGKPAELSPPERSYV
jgi:hypothetical protein